MSYTESLFKERVAQFITPAKADVLIRKCKERAIGNFFSVTPTDEFSADEFDVFMGADANDWTVKGFEYCDSHEGECVATMQLIMAEFFHAQLQSTIDFIDSMA